MLCVDRKPGESIFIGDNIEVIINRIQGQQVRVGIEAPKNMCILRSELMHKQIKDQIKDDDDEDDEYDLYI